VHLVPEGEGRPRSADREGRGRLLRIPLIHRILELRFRVLLTEGDAKRLVLEWT
jgi:hypothetical protein